MKYLVMVMLMLGSQAFAGEPTKNKEIVLTADNTLILNEDFNSESVTELMQQATKMDSTLPSGYAINLFMNTPGGSIQDGLELIEFLKGLNRPVNTITLFAASMGFQTVQQLNKRYILTFGVLMSHKARGQFSGEFGGDISQLDSRYQLWLRRIRQMDEQTVSRTNGKQTLKTYVQQYSPELWLNGSEAVAQGYADEVVTAKCDPSLNGVHTKVFNLGMFSVEVDFSNCPLKTNPIDVRPVMFTNKGPMKLQDFLAKDGRFGTNCKDRNEINEDIRYSVTNSTMSESDFVTLKQAEVCLKDKTLTIEKINEGVTSVKNKLSKKSKDSVIYSY